MKQVLIDYIKRFTDMNNDKLTEIVDQIKIEEFKKGSVLIKQGEISNKCFFVLKGCVRQYSINEDGKETTFNFLTAEQVVEMFNNHMENKESLYTFECIEDCILVVGDSEESDMMSKKYTELDSMIKNIMEENIGKMHEEYAAFVSLNPEDRYKRLLIKRPDLPDRVPQHQLASYLGITPESLSRIKKRINTQKK